VRIGCLNIRHTESNRTPTARFSSYKIFFLQDILLRRYGFNNTSLLFLKLFLCYFKPRHAETRPFGICDAALAILQIRNMSKYNRGLSNVRVKVSECIYTESLARYRHYSVINILN
jgi:hypothetical protein